MNICSMNTDGDLLKQLKDGGKITWDASTSRDSMERYAIAGATAYAVSELMAVTGLQDLKEANDAANAARSAQATGSGVTGIGGIGTISANTASAQLSTLEQVGVALAESTVSSTVAVTTQSAINGESFSDASKNLARDILIGVVANLTAKEIGTTYKNSDKDGVDRTIQLASHGALGCVSGAAGGGDCASGAVSGITGELVGSALRPSVENGSMDKETAIQIAGLSGGFSAIFTGGLTGQSDSETAQGIYSGQRIGGNAARNNALFYRAGTFSDPEKTEKEFIEVMEKSTGQKVIVLPNKLYNTDESRQELAQEMAKVIRNYNFTKDEPLILVGHSHGGNVIKILSGMDLGREIDSVILLGAPHRKDYKMNYSQVKPDAQLINIYDKGDWFIQDLIGGTDTPSINILGYDIHYPVIKDINPSKAIDNYNNVESHQGGSIFIERPTFGILRPRAREITFTNGAFDSHSNMDSKEIWKSFVEPNLNQDN